MSTTLVINTPARTREVVDTFFARFAEGDIPALLDLFADGVVFHVGGAPNIPWAGSRTSKDDIAAFRLRPWERLSWGGSWTPGLA